MFQKRSSQRTSSKASRPSTIFPRTSYSFSHRVRILILNSCPFFNHTIPTGIYSEPPTNHEAPSDPQGQIPEPFSYPLSKVNATQLNGGSVKIVDSTTFKISKRIAVADVTVEPGALRELHVRVRVLFFAIIVALTSAMSCSGIRHRTSGFTFCKDTISRFPRRNFGTEARFTGKAMAA
jgi:hypothetical protein